VRSTIDSSCPPHDVTPRDVSSPTVVEHPCGGRGDRCAAAMNANTVRAGQRCASPIGGGGGVVYVSRHVDAAWHSRRNPTNLRRLHPAAVVSPVPHVTCTFTTMIVSYENTHRRHNAIVFFLDDIRRKPRGLFYAIILTTLTHYDTLSSVSITPITMLHTIMIIAYRNARCSHILLNIIVYYMYVCTYIYIIFVKPKNSPHSNIRQLIKLLFLNPFHYRTHKNVYYTRMYSFNISSF